MAHSPYKFLDSYTHEDRDIFFGRENEIEELHYKILDHNLLIVYGSSGTGKSSLIQCGLASKFNDADWMPIIIRRGDNINNSIKNTLQNLSLTSLKARNNLAKNLQSVYLDYFKPIFLLFDQFEELFIFGNDEEIAQFTDELKACLDINLSCRFIFVIRGEYLEHIARFEDKIPDFFNNRMRIERMTRKNAIRVITEPARLFNIKVVDGFPAKVLDKLAGNKGSVELTYLQVYLDKLYKKALIINPESPEFNEALLETSGRIDDVLAEFLEEQIAKTTHPEVATTILKAFVSNEGTKKQMTGNDIGDFTLAMGEKIPIREIDLYIRQFVDLRILKDQDENGKYELRHDALAAKIFDQISHSEREILEVRQFIVNRYQEFLKRGIYLEYSDIQYILPFEKKMVLSPEQKEFVNKSIRLSKKKIRVRRNIIAGSVTSLILILSIFSFYALWQRNLARSQTINAETQKKNAELKEKEAVSQKLIAEKAKNNANLETQKANEAKANAEKEKARADSQFTIANIQSKLARDQAANAKTQKDIAERERSSALEAKKNADSAKNQAQNEKKSADNARQAAERLRMISLSQTVAFKSLQIKNDTQLSALLAQQAYNFSAANNGNTQDPQIFKALFESLKLLSPSNYPNLVEIPAEIQSLQVTPNGHFTLISSDGKLLNYVAKENKISSSVSIAGKDIIDSWLSRDTRFAVTTYSDFSIRMWNTATVEGTVKLEGHTDFVQAADFSTDGKTIITGGRDSSVILWKNGLLQKKIKFPSRIRAVTFAINNNKILAGCENGVVYSFDLTENNLTVLLNHAPARINNINYSSNKHYIVISSSGGQISLLNSETLQIAEKITERKSIVFISVDDENDQMAVATTNRLVHIYDLRDALQKPLEINDITSPIKGIGLNNRGMLTVACDNNSLRSYSIRSSELVGQLEKLIKRELSIEEWNTYIGRDIPFKK